MELCKKFGVGIMDVKKVFVVSEGDMDKVMDYFCEKGIVKVVKKSDWIVVEGLIDIVVKGNIVVIVELNFEIDFVVVFDLFKVVLKDVVNLIVDNKLVDVEVVLELKMVNGMFNDDLIVII